MNKPGPRPLVEGGAVVAIGAIIVALVIFLPRGILSAVMRGIERLRMRLGRAA